VRTFGNVQAAVVAGKDHDRSIPKSRRIEMREEPSHAVVERLYRRRVRRIERAAIRLDERRPRRPKRDVRIVVGQVQDEGPIAVRIDEPLGLPRQIVLTLAGLVCARLRRRLTGMEDVESLLAG
jgi:hypothetical protein